jgi:SPOR domain
MEGQSMNSLLRHTAVRFWVTGLAGGLFCLVLVPQWQRILGLHWLVLPAAFVLCAFFGGAGWMMNRMGMVLTRRQVNEAVAWERAGMIHEAETAFQRAAALFDSFWLSPFFRRKNTRWLYGVLVKFQLSQFPGTPYSRTLAANYLKSYPEDRIVAENWLEELVSWEQCSDQEHEAVVRVAEALDQHKPVQQLVMQFYLANGRIDFDARQTYRRVWKNQQPLESRQTHALARLLLHESIINPWALQVYLEAYQTGMADALEGVAAGLRLVPVGEEGRKDLAAAQQLVAGQDAEKMKRLGSRFKLPETGTDHRASKRVPRQGWQVVPGTVRAAGTAVSIWSKRLPGFLMVLLKWLTGPGPRYRRYCLGALGVGALVLLMVMVGRHRRPAGPSAIPPPAALQSVEKKAVITDPFTIQVAAYLKAPDAQRVVDRLIGQKLDAYWTKAASANRTWYQVKVSHFATREAAQQYGQDLKSRGLIDDFFVANYKPRESKS